MYFLYLLVIVKTDKQFSLEWHFKNKRWQLTLFCSDSEMWPLQGEGEVVRGWTARRHEIRRRKWEIRHGGNSNRRQIVIIITVESGNQLYRILLKPKLAFILSCVYYACDVIDNLILEIIIAEKRNSRLRLWSCVERMQTPIEVYSTVILNRQNGLKARFDNETNWFNACSVYVYKLFRTLFSLVYTIYNYLACFVFPVVIFYHAYYMITESW